MGPSDDPLVLLTGATGYVGGRLLRALENAGHRVRCLARRPAYLGGKTGFRTEVVEGDVFDRKSLAGALDGVRTAYYLIHSLGEGASFAAADRRAASGFAEAAREAGLARIIYLGGLGRQEAGLSAHLRSRQEVGDALRASGVPVVEFRAAIIIGSGSLSFEIIRALVERVPVMVAPRWVRTLTQPIAIEDVVQYLVAAAEREPGPGRIFEIGGADQVTYGDILMEYARQRGLRRLIIPVPVLTPRLSSLWLVLVTPVHARAGRLLIEGLRNPTLVEDNAALTAFPVRPMGMKQAIARALENEDHEFAETRWSDALSSGASVRSWAGVRFGARLVDSRVVRVAAPPARAFAPIRRIGGATGWYYANWLWRLRGFLDTLAGGVGLRRGRKNPEWVEVGDTLDFWRVEAFQPGRRLRLAAEMKVPGRAWLEFEVEGDADSSTIRQTAIFDPAGLAGLLYWYVAYPLHRLMFRGMLDGIARAVE